MNFFLKERLTNSFFFYEKRHPERGMCGSLCGAKDPVEVKAEGPKGWVFA